jgi:hypothetical protein
MSSPVVQDSGLQAEGAGKINPGDKDSLVGAFFILRT